MHDKNPDKETLLLCDLGKGEVFTFKLSTGQKEVRVTSLKMPRSKGSDNGKLNFPMAAIASDSVSDSGNKRVSQFSTDGVFLRHLLVQFDMPYSISYSYPHLWVVSLAHSGNKNTKLYRYKIW